MTILIASDDRVLTIILTARLKNSGFKVVEACDAMQAIMAALRSPPAAVLLNFDMPGGLQILRQLRNSVKTSRVPIIVVSGSLEPERERTARKLGADDYLRRPLDCGQLLDKISQLLKRSSANAQRTVA